MYREHVENCARVVTVVCRNIHLNLTNNIANTDFAKFP